MRNATLTAVRHATDLRRKADAKAQAAERDLHRAVLTAHADGWSYRAISEVAGISHQRVSQIVQASKAS